MINVERITLENIVKGPPYVTSVVKKGITQEDALPRFQKTTSGIRIKDHNSDPYRLWQKILRKSRMKRMFPNQMSGFRPILRAMQRQEALKWL